MWALTKLGFSANGLKLEIKNAYILGGTLHLPVVTSLFYFEKKALILVHHLLLAMTARLFEDTKRT